MNYSGGNPDLRANDISQFIHNLIGIQFKAETIEAFRQITQGENDSNINGKGLIIELRKLQNPKIEEYEPQKNKYSAINHFLKDILGEKDAQLEIPAELDDIYVLIKNKRLPLASLGTGIHEIIILASAVTVKDNVMFCIEEPEIHLHPEMQKKFINYIKENTNNQYLITTHSNACFDIAGVNIYHCYLEGHFTKCDLVTTDREKGGILSDLGYKPSDLLQSNFVIWVEGPSDRIYLKHWIEGIAPELEEGLHYSIMFYGGSLLKYVTFDSAEIDEFVKLCKLNRHAAIVIDSDKEYQQTKINDTKKRVEKSFIDNECFSWITKGREIENYIPEEIFNRALLKAHPRKGNPIIWEQYGNITRFPDGKDIDKIAVARSITSENADYTVLDLKINIEKLIECIKTTNQ